MSGVNEKYYICVVCIKYVILFDIENRSIEMNFLLNYKFVKGKNFLIFFSTRHDISFKLNMYLPCE